MVSSHGRACCIVAGRLLPEYGVLLGVPSAHAECMCPHRRWVTRFVPAGLSCPAKTQTMIVHSEPMAGGRNLVPASTAAPTSRGATAPTRRAQRRGVQLLALIDRTGSGTSLVIAAPRLRPERHRRGRRSDCAGMSCGRAHHSASSPDGIRPSATIGARGLSVARW